MRRAGAALAALLLTLALSSSVAATTARSSFNGDFDVFAGDTLVGHITAQIPADSTTVGSWLFVSPDGSRGTGVISEPAYFHHDTYNEVWFNAVEVASPTSGYGIFTGHFVDMLDGTADYVEVWSNGITDNGFFNVSFGSQFHNDPAWTVGGGAFVLKVRGS